MTSVELAIHAMEQYHNELSDYVSQLKARAGDTKLDEFADMRHYSLETIREHDIFYIGDATEMLVPAYFDKLESFGVISPTNKKPIFHDRFVIPIKNTEGKVINLVGYSKEANERYVYGTSKYYSRRETLFGLENLKLAYDLGYAILTEGITDTICLRNLGFKNTFAMCGTHDSKYIMNQLNRCRHGVIELPDRDMAGLRASKKWKCNRSLTINTFIQFKDIDEMCSSSVEMQKLAIDYINEGIEWIKSKLHRGLNCGNEIITIQ